MKVIVSILIILLLFINVGGAGYVIPYYVETNSSTSATVINDSDLGTNVVMTKTDSDPFDEYIPPIIYVEELFNISTINYSAVQLQSYYNIGIEGTHDIILLMWNYTIRGQGSEARDQGDLILKSIFLIYLFTISLTPPWG